MEMLKITELEREFNPLEIKLIISSKRNLLSFVRELGETSNCDVCSDLYHGLLKRAKRAEENNGA